MNEQDFLELLAPIFTDNAQIDISISIRDLWFIDSVLALGWRHPDITLHQKNWMLHLHDQIIIPILEKYPQAKDLIAAGWDTNMDVAQDPDKRASLNEQYRQMSKRYLRKTGRT